MRAPVHFDNARNDGLIICEREDFSDYMWMADEESFDKQVLAELQEEEEMEQCMEEMLAEEEARDTTYYVVGNDNGMIPTAVIQQSSLEPLAMGVPHWTHHGGDLEQQEQLQQPVVVPAAALNSTEILSVSQLNPEASEFVPSRSAHPVSPSMASAPPVTEAAPAAIPPSLSSEDATLSKSGTSETPDR